VRPLSLADLQEQARRKLPDAVYDFFAGGADDEITLRANETAFGRIGLVPRVLRGATERDIGLDLLGCASSMPVLLAPTAFHRLAHEDGERATARAAAAAGVIMIVSMASTVAIKSVASAAGGGPPPWFQLGIQPDRGFTAELVRRAEDAGCAALVLSVDAPVFGRRERDLRNGFLDLPDGLCAENLRDASGRVRRIEFSPAIGWADVEWLRGLTALPIVLKGVMHRADAALAARRGAAAVIVSNHGGRQLDTVPASIDLLPPIVDAVDGAIPVLLDGGIRRGTDVVKALALGATAVGIGRPVLWGLAAAGEEGVRHVLELLHAELDRTLALCGCESLSDLNRSFVCDPLDPEGAW
jgi:4-hydroxymandelate oxidase